MSDPRERVLRALLVLAAVSLVIIRLPYLVEYRTRYVIASLIPLAAGVLWLLGQPRRFKVNGPLASLSLGLIALISIAMFRAGTDAGFGKTSDVIAQSATITMVWLFGLLFFATARSADEFDRRLAAAALAPGIYIAVNLAMQFAGIHASSIAEVDAGEASLAANTPAETLGFFGIHVNRVVFPMDPSVNGMGVVAAAGFASSWILWSRSRRRPDLRAWNRISLGCAVACLVAILLTDTRAALLVAIGAAAFVTWRRRPRIAPFLLMIIPFSALLVITLSGWLIGLDFGGADVLSRNSGDVSTGSLRFEIWRPAWDTFRHAGAFEQIVGFGANGQYTSGASLQYYSLFRSAHSPLLTHVHNLGLQVLLDMGVFGLVVLSAAAYGTTARLEAYLRSRPAGPAEAILAGVLTVFICGATETSPTYRTQETLLYAMLLFGAASALPTIGRARIRSTQLTRVADLPSVAEIQG